MLLGVCCTVPYHIIGDCVSAHLSDYHLLVRSVEFHVVSSMDVRILGHIKVEVRSSGVDIVMKALSLVVCAGAHTTAN